jgi:hypothetical protein
VTEELYYGSTGDGPAIGPLEELITVYPVVFNVATATEAVRNIIKKPRPAGTRRLSHYYRITAAGRAEDGTERTVRAVVRRQARGSNISFSLLYWDDNFLSRRRSEDAPE